MGRLEEMQAFVGTAEAQSFTAAAQRLGVSKSIVSQRVADLETRLGVRLVNRTTRRLSLTEAGVIFLDGARRVLQDADAAEEAAARPETALSGTLRIAAPLSFSMLHLKGVVQDFMEANPGLDVYLDLDDRRVDLVSGGFDMALRIGRLPDSSLVARRLAPIRSVVCASRAYLDANGTPERPEDLAGHRCLIYHNVDRGDYWTFETPEGPKPFRVAGRLASNNGELLLDAAIAGEGLVVSPTFICGDALADGRLVHVLADWPLPEFGLHAVYPPGRHIGARVRLFTEFFARRIGAEPYWEPAACRVYRHQAGAVASRIKASASISSESSLP